MKQRIKAHEHDLQTDKHMREKKRWTCHVEIRQNPTGEKNKKAELKEIKWNKTQQDRETDGQKAQEEERKKRGGSVCL